MKKYREICVKCGVFRSLTGEKDFSQPIGGYDVKGFWEYSGNKKCKFCTWRKMKDEKTM